MDLALLIARLVLSVVFSVAGVAKLLDREGSRAALVGFGVPERGARPLAVALPLAELAVALALLPLATAFWGGTGALTLLGLFVIGIALSMARGEAPDCHCFGQLHSEPAGWRTLIRNGALALVAAFVISGGAEPGASLTGWFGDLTTAEQVGLAALVVAGTILAGQSWFLFQLMAQNGRLLTRVELLEAGAPSTPGRMLSSSQPNLHARGLPVGAPAPAFSLAGLYGETITLNALRAAGKPVVLLFTDPNCAPCNAMLPEVARWQREHAGRMTIAPISRGDTQINLDKASGHGISTVLLQRDHEVSNAYEAQGTPTAVLVRLDGTIGSPVAAGAPQIKQLVDTILQQSPEPAAPAGAARGSASSNGAQHAQQTLPRSTPGRSAAPLTPMPPGGAPLPRIVLPDVAGDMIDLSDLGGRPTVLLFWNPSCGFCQRMFDDLKAWTAERPAHAPELMILSSGGIDARQVMALQVPFLLDEGFEAGRRLGATGTPAALLVNGDGKIASPVMVGAERVMGLLDPARRLAPTNGNGAQQPLPPLVRLGSPAPAFELSDLDGELVSADVFAGVETLVLFWDPSCGFCQQMRDDLRMLDTQAGARRLLVVSTGAVAVNQALGLRSTVLLDQGFDLGRRFGVSGTPSAVLVDRKGRIASAVAAGAPAVLELAGLPARSS